MYLRDIYLDNANWKVIMKSTQCGISELLIVYTIDLAMKGLNIFYILPDLPIMRRFVLNRFNKSMSYSKFYRSLRVKDREDLDKTESMSLKDIGKGTVAFVGSKTSSPFTEFPADVKVVDEEDQCNQDNLAMGDERLSHSDYQFKFNVSNPTIEDYAIHEDYLESDQKNWYIKCSRCGKWIQPNFFTHVVKQVDVNDWIILDRDWSVNSLRDVHVICEYCNKAFDRFADGVWISLYDYKEISGYHINKVFSSNVTIDYMVNRFSAGLANPGKLQRFYNGDCGLPLTASGSKINETMLNECRGDYLISTVHGYTNFNEKDIIFSGVDVGAKLHVTIWRLTPDGKSQSLYIGAVVHPEDYIKLHNRFKVKLGIIDANPETRMSKKIASTLKNMFICYYGQVKKDIVDGLNRSITVDRTQALDAVQEAVILKNLILPVNAKSVEDFYKQMTKSTRIYEEEKEKYTWTKCEDHYFHSTAYAMLAKKFASILMSHFT